MLEDSRLVQQGGVGDDLLLTTLLVTEITSTLDPTPLSDGINGTLLIVDGRYGEAAFSFGGMLAPGALSKLGDLDNVMPSSVDLKRICPDGVPNCFVAGTQVVVVLESVEEFSVQTAYGNILAGAVAFTLAVGLGFRPGQRRRTNRRKTRTREPVQV